jgi:hypothetical protein
MLKLVPLRAVGRDAGRIEIIFGKLKDRPRASSRLITSSISTSDSRSHAAPKTSSNWSSVVVSCSGALGALMVIAAGEWTSPGRLACNSKSFGA